jgi:tetratricopeptide (TPR) repeat protein
VPHDKMYLDSNSTAAEASPPSPAAKQEQATTGEDADSLYAQGMAHYRRREWQAAKDCFLRLKSVAPERRGVDALLNEVDLFLQLAAMQPAGQQQAAAPEEEVEEARSEEPLQPAAAIQTVRRRSTGSIILVILAVLVIVSAVLYTTGMLDSLLGNQRQARVQVLVNQGRAALNVGDYERAVQAFGEALALAPTNEDVKTWYAKAQRYQQLTSWYEQADEDIKAQRWDDALANLDRIMAIEPTYKDTSTKIEFVKSQQTLDARFAEAKQYLEQGKWDEVIKILEPLREQDPTFNPDEVEQTLFYAHFRQGVEWLADAGASPDTALDLISQAIQSFDRALALFPTDTTALEERRLADLYRQGHLFVNQKNWPQAVLVLQQIESARPDYMGGQATEMLCSSYLQLGDAYYAAGSLPQALEQYRNVLAIEGCDHVDAALREREVYNILYPPTPTPTDTRTPTHTPRPTLTWTPTPTATRTPTLPPYTPPPPPRPTSRPTPLPTR